jgi:acetone carboxylase gamma subunit
MVKRVAITEYLAIDLGTERWHCRPCGHEIGPARASYKEGLLVYDRDPREIHHPILDSNYPYTYAPDPKWVRILEFYCPACGTMIENEYLPPGCPITHDIELDIDGLKARYADLPEEPEHAPR